MNAHNATSPTTFLWWMSWAGVNKLAHESVQTQLNLFFGRLDQFFLGPAQWWWLEVTPFLMYSTKLGRKWNITQEVLKKLIFGKWYNGSPLSTSPWWHFTWHKHKARIEATFLWRVIHTRLWLLMNDVDAFWWRSIRSVPIVVHDPWVSVAHDLQLPIGPTSVAVCN